MIRFVGTVWRQFARKKEYGIRLINLHEDGCIRLGLMIGVVNLSFNNYAIRSVNPLVKGFGV